MTNTRTLTIILVTLMVAGSLLTFTPKEGEAVVVPYFEIRMDPASVSLDVAPGGNPTTQVNCIVNNPTAHQETIRVIITAAGLTVTPSIIMVTVGGGQEVTLPVSVAAEPRTARRFISVNVMGVLEKVDGVTTPVSYEAYSGFQVLINQYARVVLSVDQPFQKVKPGKEYHLNMKIVNDGNDRDKFQLLCTNKKELEKVGYSIIIVPTVTADIDSQKYTEVKVVVQTPKDLWINEYHPLEFEAHSMLQGTNEKTSLSMTQWVWGVYVPTFDPIFILVAVAAMAVGLRKRLGIEEEDIDWEEEIL